MTVVEDNTAKTAVELASFQSELNSFNVKHQQMESRIQKLEQATAGSQNWEQDHWYLQRKLVDMEDRNRRENIQISGIKENLEGKDMISFLTQLLPDLTSLQFSTRIPEGS